jgi:hypothetical protein
MTPQMPERQGKMPAALVIFAKAPIPGQVKTRLTPTLTEDEAATLHGSFVLDTLARTKAAGDGQRHGRGDEDPQRELGQEAHALSLPA